ncbi:putative SAG-related sequence protein SRS22E [Toxoplasma gondii TgCatPRC2]|uniref:Putative SAG-related sequence protein SRS22E n=2 Tax=Toxoplasma gondii TaxID=5811 RepID=A0A151H072_TOXGO|nr:putative SAG-related sequence protein SRS22E [Toxoplasma gondii ARI]KYK62727.1 putative SAG-related sequence protein SRS22E [Toxoplasma gondii TgCatPRC2]
MKFSLLTLAALAVSTHQVSALQAKSDPTTDQQADVTIQTCKQGQALSFNVTEAGQSILFKCDQALQFLDPALVVDNPMMYKGSEPVQIHEFLPRATLTEVTAAGGSDSATVLNAAKHYNFTVSTLPSEPQHLHVTCTDKQTGAESKNTEKKECTVNFHIASSAVRPALAASAIAGVVAALLHFA